MLKANMNPILNGFRFILNRRKDDATYWKCSLFTTGCPARITTVDEQLISPVPVHTHEPQHAENTVHIAKAGTEKKSWTDLPTKYLAAETVSGMGFEARSKLGCQISGLSRMARRKRHAVSRHPLNPTSLETLTIPSDYILSSNNECMIPKKQKIF
ncbi:hypothetical protein ACHWQZ_G000624 [Mnemiopsis leidyi]